MAERGVSLCNIPNNAMKNDPYFKFLAAIIIVALVFACFNTSSVSHDQLVGSSAVGASGTLSFPEIKAAVKAVIGRVAALRAVKF